MAFSNFSSLIGISLSSAGAGDVARISYRLNCKDEVQLNKFIISRNMLEDLVYPEIMERVSKGTLSTNFRLRKAHILMFSEELKNKILLNNRTRFRVQVRLKAEADNKHRITENDIEDVLGIYPSEQNDPNAAHIMMFRFKGDWLISYDFTYNSKKAREHIELAKVEIKDSEQALEKGDLKRSIRKQQKATILVIQSTLVLNNPRLSFKASPDLLNPLFSEYLRNGNLDVKFSDLLIQDNLDLKASVNRLKHCIQLTKELVEHADMKLRTIEFYRSTPPGIYINSLK